MVLVLKEEKEQESQSRLKVDPAVAVRFDYLMDTANQLSDTEIDLEMKKLIQRESASVSLNNMIKGMVREFGYTKARLSLAELTKRFEKNNLAALISRNFANSLLDLDTDPRIKSDQEDALSKEAQTLIDEKVIRLILAFLKEKGLNSAVTLYQFLAQLKRRYPAVCFSELFSRAFRFQSQADAEATTLVTRVTEKIEDSFPALAGEAYLDKFKEDSRGFVMGFMMGRVIKFDRQQNKSTFDRKEFYRLMEYLDSVGANVVRFGEETLYDWLFAESRQMKAYIDERKVEAGRLGVRDDLAKVGVSFDEGDQKEKDKIFFANSFDVRAFYSAHIMPAVFKFYSKKKSKVKELEDADLLHDLNDVNNVGLSNYTFQLTRYLKDLLRTGRKKPKVFMAKFREMFGFTDIPTGEKKITQKHVNEFIAVSFRRAKIKFERLMEQAMVFRDDEEAKTLLSYPKEILDCDNLVDLIEYVLNPDAFIGKYPQYKDVPKYRIAFAASAFLMDFLKTSKKMVDESFLSAEKRQDLAEKNFVKALDIKVLKSLDIPMRVVEALDENGKLRMIRYENNAGKFYEKPDYSMVFDPTNVEEFAHIMPDRRMGEVAMITSPKEATEFPWKGERFRLLPVEKKNFQKVKMTIKYHTIEIDEKTGERMYVEKKREVIALIYSGDGRLVHLKNKFDKMITDDRGKEISDECRTMIVFANQEDEDAFRKFQLTKQIRGVVKVDDNSRNRKISTKTGPKTEKASAQRFKEDEHLKTAKRYLFPELIEGLTVDENGKEVMGLTISMIGVTMEIQVNSLDTTLISNLSKYTPADHDKYRAKRTWPILFKYYFPPYIFGDAYKVLQDQGIYGGKK